MGIPDRALALEKRAMGRSGEQTLPAAYELLYEQWQSSDNDRELGLHLMFLAWYLCAEPEFLTGYEGDRMERDGSSGRLADTFVEVHDALSNTMAGDAEFNFVVSVMASTFPWCCDPTQAPAWERTAVERRRRYQRRQPRGLAPSIFEGRGYYGEYFLHSLRIHG